MLEGGGGISETKEHHGWFNESLMGDEGSFPLMPVLDSDIIVSLLNIEFGEDSRKSSVAFRSSEEREYTLPILGLKVSSRLIL